MIASEVYALFIASVLVMQITPGPDTLLVVSNGIYGGYKRGLFYVAGITLAGLIQIPLIVLGIGKIIRESAPLYDALCLAGALYLLYVGYRMIRNAGLLQVSAKVLEERTRRIDQAVWQGLVNNLLNPKVFIFMLAIIPLFVDPRGDVPLQLLILAVTMKLCGLAVNSTYAVIGATASQILQPRPNILWYQRVFSGCVVLLLGATALGFNPVFGWSWHTASVSQHSPHQEAGARAAQRATANTTSGLQESFRAE